MLVDGWADGRTGHEITHFCSTENAKLNNLDMELFSSRRWRLYRPKQKAVVFILNPKNYATHAWHYSIHVWLLGQSSCLSPTSKKLHDLEDGDWTIYVWSLIIPKVFCDKVAIMGNRMTERPLRPLNASRAVIIVATPCSIPKIFCWNKRGIKQSKRSKSRKEHTLTPSTEKSYRWIDFREREQNTYAVNTSTVGNTYLGM